MGTASRNIQVASMGGARILYGGVVLTSGQLDVDKWPKNLYDVDIWGGIALCPQCGPPWISPWLLVGFPPAKSLEEVIQAM